MQVTNINNAQPAAPYYPVHSKPQNLTCPSQKYDSQACALADKNYASLQTKKMNVTFKGAPPAAALTLSEKIGNVFNILRPNDVMVAAPTISKAVGSLEKHLTSFDTVIKRLFYIEDKTMKGALGFKKSAGDKEIINLTDRPIMILDSKKDSGLLRSGETAFLIDGDEVRGASKQIMIDEQMGPLLPIAKSFNVCVDFSKTVDPSIQQLNKKSIERIKTASSAKKQAPNKIKFSDVGGQDEAIKSLKRNILYPIKYPEIKSGNNMNKAVLLYGPPGTGKSLLAEAVSNEAGAWFKKINASELDSKYVGESEANWRNLFEEARANQPSIIFVDEFDAIAKKRGGHDVYGDKTLNTVLGLMSDSEKRGDDIYMIAATNNRKALDAAATRSGRFGVAIEVKSPDLEGTEQILKIHTKNLKLDEKFDMKSTAQKLHEQKATGADIASIAEDARNNSMERNLIYEKIEAGTYKPADMAKLRVNNEDFDKAIETFKQSHNGTETKVRPQIGFNTERY